jgi:hypothetical protein
MRAVAMRTDARIEDVLDTLADPEEFVRGILESFFREKFNRDEATVRIGTSGRGIWPHYSGEEGEVETPLPSGKTVRGYRHRAIFHGRSHKPILEDEARGINWSSAAATFAEVQSVLGRLRASKRKLSN